MSTQQSDPRTYSSPKRVLRSSEDKYIAGVCAGLAHYLKIDPTLVRVAAVVALVFGFPATVIGYVVAWAIMPTVVEAPRSEERA